MNLVKRIFLCAGITFGLNCYSQNIKSIDSLQIAYPEYNYTISFDSKTIFKTKNKIDYVVKGDIDKDGDKDVIYSETQVDSSYIIHPSNIEVYFGKTEINVLINNGLNEFSKKKLAEMDISDFKNIGWDRVGFFYIKNENGYDIRKSLKIVD